MAAEKHSDQEIAGMYATGLSCAKIAKSVGRCEGAVRDALIRAGVPRCRPTQEPQ